MEQRVVLEEAKRQLPPQEPPAATVATEVTAPPPSPKGRTPQPSPGVTQGSPAAPPRHRRPRGRPPYPSMVPSLDSGTQAALSVLLLLLQLLLLLPLGLLAEAAVAVWARVAGCHSCEPRRLRTKRAPRTSRNRSQPAAVSTRTAPTKYAASMSCCDGDDPSFRGGAAAAMRVLLWRCVLVPPGPSPASHGSRTGAAC